MSDDDFDNLEGLELQRQIEAFAETYLIVPLNDAVLTKGENFGVAVLSLLFCATRFLEEREGVTREQAIDDFETLAAGHVADLRDRKAIN